MADASAERAPIVIFAFNRPEHLRKTVEALLQNPEAAQTDLYLYCDGARAIEDDDMVEAVRRFARQVSGFRSTQVFERVDNFGLARSIIFGVTEVCGRHGRVIVVEDDIVCSPHFLSFMNSALSCYAGDDAVGSIHGYWYPVEESVPETFFLRGASCWGWATWQRSWQQFRSDGEELLDELKCRGLEGEFDLGGAVPYTRMLKEQIQGKNDSWAIRWHASMFLAGRLQLSPGTSLVQNIGFDGTGTHCTTSEAYGGSISNDPVQVRRIQTAESQVARAALIRYYHRSRRSLAKRIVARLRRFVAH